MTERESTLKNIILEDLTAKQSEHHFDYQLLDSDFDFLNQNIRKTLSLIPQDAFNCAMLSAIIGAKIYDDSEIPVVVIAGHLDFFGKRIFNCKGPIPNATENDNGEFWDGHCWLEFGGYILDISFFRTIYFGKVPTSLKNKVIDEFGNGRGALMGKPEQLETKGFNYVPCHILSQNQINGLIAGAENKYFKS